MIDKIDNLMKSQKIKRMILVAVTVSASSLVSFNLLNGGFIVALSVLVMGIFIYCYRDMSGQYIAWMVAFCSPLFRFIMLSEESGPSKEVLLMVLPDSFFYLAYGMMYAIICKYILKEEYTLGNFFYVALACDWTGNLCEIMVRSLIAGKCLIDIEFFFLLGLIALFRTMLIQFISASVEYYTNILLKQERHEMFRKLLNQASVFESEVRVMEKNIGEIEEVMRKAYDLHKISKDTEMPKETKDALLDIAKNAHEIKGDYMGVVHTLKDLYLNEFQDEKMRLSEVLSLERQNATALGRALGQDVSFVMKIKTDYILDSPFKLMSVIRNIFTNSIEAIKAIKGNYAAIVVNIEDDRDNPDLCKMIFSDNGCGIDKDMIDFIKMEGFSTKFNQKTGNIQRGLGLPVVLDIIGNEYNGTVDIESTVGKGTTVILKIPTESVGERVK
ncbi:MAG: ATP-binding protein [Clostridia bacterium]|nr:ATP-binding protein [Clostridia bacterium]